MRIVFSSLEPPLSSQDIINFCSKCPGYYKVPHAGSFIFVKRRDSDQVAEARTQEHFYHQAQRSPDAPRVPRVYEVFDDGCGSTYLVMEFISAPSFEALIDAAPSGPDQESLRATAITKIANAIAWLLKCPVPEGDSIGPVGGGYIQHVFFNMEEAPIAFATSGALEAYVNEALSRLPRKQNHRVELATETRLYSPSDVAFRNFLWDGEVVSFIDWQYVNLLPQSFASFYFHSTTDEVVQAVASRISLPHSTKLNLIEVAAYTVIQGGIQDYDLDEYGRRRQPRQLPQRTTPNSHRITLKMSTTQDPEDEVRKHFGEDKQLDTMGALALIQFVRKFNKLEPHDYDSAPPSSSDDANKMLSVLNWIANSFVREAQGGVVATALSGKDKQLTLYIAMNRGRPAKVDTDNGIKFVAALRAALKEETGMARRLLAMAAFSTSAERVWRKLEAISKMRVTPEAPLGIVAVFEDFVQNWIANGGKESNTTLEEHRAHFTSIPVSTPDAALINIFREFISLIGERGTSTVMPEEHLYLLCMLATTLCRSTFFTTLPERVKPSREPEIEEYAWLMKLRRRLWRLAHYLTDANTFISHGFKYIKKVLQGQLSKFVEDGDGFKIVWVGATLELPVNHSAGYRWPEKPGARFRNLLQTYNITLEEQKFKEANIPTHLGSVWNVERPIRPFLHCELQLIEYLQRNDIAVCQNAIGVSKLMCFACNAYVTALNDAARRSQPQQPPWLLSGPSGKAHHAWLIPRDPDEEPCSKVLSQIQTELKERLTAFVGEWKHERRQSGGSDNSAGSGDSNEHDVELLDPEGRTIMTAERIEK